MADTPDFMRALNAAGKLYAYNMFSAIIAILEETKCDGTTICFEAPDHEDQIDFSLDDWKAIQAAIVLTPKKEGKS